MLPDSIESVTRHMQDYPRAIQVRFSPSAALTV